MSFILKPTIQKFNEKPIYGFDIETYDDNRKFLLANIYGENFKQTFFNKQNVIDALKSGYFNGSIIVASNLTFDFFGLLFGNDEIKNFKFLFRGSDLIFARTYNRKIGLSSKSNGHKNAITFLDTLNYARLSVAKLGKLINIPKLETPTFIGKKPKNKTQMNQMIRYNMRDSEISFKGLKFLYDSFEDIGATAKLTIASTAMSLFKNKYLKHNYYRHDKKLLIEQFKGYYGGRTEAFARGKFKNYKYFDLNSLYPSVMLKHKYPDPNSLRICHFNDDFHIREYEGLSDITIFCPEMEYPLLPYRTKDKLLFPTGKFRGYHTHAEIRKAVELGYKILKVHRTLYFKKTCEPFKEFVADMYAKRLKLKSQKSSMEYVVKILMNSLYGKFAESFIGKENLVPFNHSADELHKMDFFEIIGDYLRIKQDRFPAVHCIPIWSIYVTSYARLRLYEYIRVSHPLYCDTDSIITRKTFKDSKELGDMKLEFIIKEGIIVKPKFYAFTGINNCDTIKIKGIGTKIVMRDFVRLVKGELRSISYTKFCKVREALRRGYVPNEIIAISKHLQLNDNKRLWDEEFNPSDLQFSKALNIQKHNILEPGILKVKSRSVIK